MEQKDSLYTMLEEDRQRCDDLGHPDDLDGTCSSITSDFNFLPTASTDQAQSNKLSLSVPNDNNRKSSSGLLPPSPSLSRRNSIFDSYKQPSRRPSVFDRDPCRLSCQHRQQADLARRKINLVSNSKARRVTVGDLEPSRMYFTSNLNTFPFLSLANSAKIRKYSLDLSFPLNGFFPSNSLGKKRKKKNFKPVDKSFIKPVNGSSSLLSTACGFAVIIVVFVWALPYFFYYFLLLFNSSTRGPNPF